MANQVGPDGNGKMLKDVGFTLNIVCTTFDSGGGIACELLKNAVESLNPRYHVTVWHEYGLVFGGWGVQRDMPMFAAGSSASFFPDPHELTTTFYDSSGTSHHGKTTTTPQ